MTEFEDRCNKKKAFVCYVAPTSALGYNAAQLMAALGWECQAIFKGAKQIGTYLGGLHEG